MKTQTPLWLFALRLAARLSNYSLLAFALFSLAALNKPDPQTLAFLLLMLMFCMVNLRAISLAILPLPRPTNDGPSPQPQRYRTWAHLLSAALPLAYVAGIWQADLFETLQLRQAVAVTAPPLLNWLAIEQTRQTQAANDQREP